MKYDLAVFIGRFQPFHRGHYTVIETAFKTTKNVVILVGSTDGPRNLRNPFTFEEREFMIRAAFSAEENKRLFFEPLVDSIYNDDIWISNVQEAVHRAFVKAAGPWHPLAKVALVGHAKDHTSFYLKLFPQWESIDVPQFKIISATSIRDAWLDTPSTELSRFNDIIPPNTKQFLHNFMLNEKTSPYFVMLVRERKFIREYKKAWESAPYEPTFVTVDAVVIQSGHILLVKRKSEPGKGLWAMPGGFINPKEKIENAVIRELREETKIKVPEPVLRGSIKKREVFDDPERSQRGRTITHAFLIDLVDDVTLPKVKGSDDAEAAKWIPLSEVKRSDMFEDHFSIIQKMTGGF